VTKPKVVSLFCGAGGMDLGFHQAGFETVWANDFNERACETYRANFKNPIVCGDVTKIASADIPDCDIVIGGPPCQGFSQAGKMDRKDPRSRLLWEFHRIVSDKRPRWFLMENVPNLFENPRFSWVIDDFLAALGKDGWRLKFRVMNSADHGVAQNRRRFFVVGLRDDADTFEFPAPLPKKVSVREALAGLPKPGVGINPKPAPGRVIVATWPRLTKSPYSGMIFNGTVGRPIDPSKQANTLVATCQVPIVDQELLDDPNADSWIVRLHADLCAGKKIPPSTPVPSHVRRLTVRELARLQGFPDDFTFVGSHTAVQRQIGNSVTPPLARRIAERILSGEVKEPPGVLSLF